VQDHVRDHLNDYVATCVIVAGGELRHGDGYSIGRPLRTLFYVCPRSGILKKNRKVRPWYFGRIEKLPTRFLGDGTALVRKDGAWHIIEWRELRDYVHLPGQRQSVPARHLPVWDALLKTTIYRDQAERIYSRPVYAVSARRASKREVRRITNSYPYASLVRTR